MQALHYIWTRGPPEMNLQAQIELFGIRNYFLKDYRPVRFFTGATRRTAKHGVLLEVQPSVIRSWKEGRPTSTKPIWLIYSGNYGSLEIRYAVIDAHLATESNQMPYLGSIQLDARNDLSPNGDRLSGGFRTLFWCPPQGSESDLVRPQLRLPTGQTIQLVERKLEDYYVVHHEDRRHVRVIQKREE